MSSSETPPTGTIVVHGHPGSEIRVLDKDFVLRARGTVTLAQALPVGVYMVNWVTGPNLQQEVVRLRADKAIEVHAPDLPKTVGLPELYQATTIVSQPAVTSRTRRSEVIVLVESEGIDLDPSEIRLFRAEETAGSRGAMRQSPENGTELPIEETAVSRAYGVRAGLYRLQYRTSGGETVSQTVPAFAGRRSVVVLEPEQADVLLKDRGKLITKSYNGIREGSATIVTVDLKADDVELREAVRIGRALLDGLDSQRTPLGETLLNRLTEKASDPLCRLYAAWIIFERLRLNKSPLLDAPIPTAVKARDAFRKRWLRQARALCRGNQKGIPDDFPLLHRQCMHELKRAEPIHQLLAPPLLYKSWLLAAFSASEHKIVPNTYAFRGAVSGAIKSELWFMWRVSAAKSATFKLTTETFRRVVGTMLDAAHHPLALSFVPGASTVVKVTDLLRGYIPPGSIGVGREITSTLGIVGHTGSAQRTKSRNAILLANNYLVAETSRSQLDYGSGSLDSSRDANFHELKVPPLLEAIINPDDPHRERFGGEATRAGFRLSATFGLGEDENSVAVRLRIQSLDRSDRFRALFCLHDTFEPDRLFRLSDDNGVAEVEVIAGGGFTVGGWIEDRYIPLELDLKTIPGAPRIIRER